MRRPLPETLAIARGQTSADPSPDALIARNLARRLFAALRARVGDEMMTLLEPMEREQRVIADATFDAADRLWRARQIYVEPQGRSAKAGAWELPPLYLIIYPDGTQRHVDEASLLAMAGISL